MSSIVLFEDDQVSQLDPVATGKPAFAITCGGNRLIDVARELSTTVRAVVRPHLRAVQQADEPVTVITNGAASTGSWWVNARLVPSMAVRRRLAEVIAAARPCIVRHGDHVALAWAPAGESGAPLSADAVPLSADADPVAAFVRQLPGPGVDLDLPLFSYPHDILRHHLASIGENLAERARGDYRQLSDGLFVAADVTLGEHLVTDTRSGPILIDQGATIGPFCYLRGPIYVGPRARLIEHASVKDGTTLGHTTKVGGEVEASIIEPYTNKQHHGFLGHSYLGSWINLGAGTSNSDLKNTYGPVNMEYRGKKTTTGMQFVGCFAGDYAKTAINTGIFTGKTIGVGSMVYGFVTTNVPSFVNYARLFGQVTELPPEVMIASQQRMFQRRGVQQRPCDIQLLHDMYHLTRHERQLAGEPLVL